MHGPLTLDLDAREVLMVSDDFTALAAISMGALAPVALTIAFMAQSPETSRSAGPSSMTLVEACAATPANVVDFAIIRGRPGTDGREGEAGVRSAWVHVLQPGASSNAGRRSAPDKDMSGASLELRLLRMR